MHVLIVNFGLDGISEEQYGGLAESVASAFADLPGLVSKAWLANEETSTYGGVYVWRDREAMEVYRRNDIYKGMATNPHFKDVTVKDFAILENPTRITRGPAEAALRVGRRIRAGRVARSRRPLDGGTAPRPDVFVRGVSRQPTGGSYRRRDLRASRAGELARIDRKRRVYGLCARGGVNGSIGGTAFSEDRRGTPPSGRRFNHRGAEERRPDRREK